MGRNSGMCDGPEGVIFSLRDGDVWASRSSNHLPLILGPHDEVVEAMHDFIRQAEFAQRLLNKADRNARATD